MDPINGDKTDVRTDMPRTPADPSRKSCCVQHPSVAPTPMAANTPCARQDPGNKTAVPVAQLLSLNPRERLYVHPLRWTQRHLDLLGCDFVFEGSIPLPRCSCHDHRSCSARTCTPPGRIWDQNTRCTVMNSFTRAGAIPRGTWDVLRLTESEDRVEKQFAVESNVVQI